MASQVIKERLSDFSGGLSTRDSPNKINSKNSPTTTNVWYDGGSLKKRNGATLDTANASISGKSDFQYNFFGSQIKTFSNVTENGLMCIGPIRTISTSGIVRPVDRNAVIVMQDFSLPGAVKVIARRAFSGTVDVVLGSPTITVTDTSIYKVGDYLNVSNLSGSDSAAQMFLIQSIDSATTMTATTNSIRTLSGAGSNLCTIIPTWTLENRVSISEMNSKVWLSGNGSVSGSFTFNSDFTTSIITAVDAFPQAAYTLPHKNYMFAANYGATSSRIAWSSLKDPTTWPASNFIDVNPDDGFPIVGLFFDGQAIVILKTNKAYKLTGDVFDPSNPTYTLTQIYTPSDFLISSARTVQMYNGKYIMLGNNGFYAYDGGSKIDDMPKFDIVRNQFQSVQGFSISSAPAIYTEPSSISINGDYWLSVESSTFSHTAGYKNVIYVLDKNGAFWRWNQNIDAEVSDFSYHLGTVYATNGNISSTSGIQTLNTGSVDTGSIAINATWTSKVFNFKNKQQFLYCYVYYKKQSAGNLTFEYSIDEGAFSSATIDMTAGTGTRVKSSRILLGQFGSSIQFRLSNAVASQTFEVYGIEYVRRDLKV